MTLPPLPDPAPAMHRLLSSHRHGEDLARQIKQELVNYAEAAVQAALNRQMEGPLPEPRYGAVGQYYSPSDLRAAVLMEREECARAAEEYLTQGRSPLGRAVAAAIRGRR